jgi:integrase
MNFQELVDEYRFSDKWENLAPSSRTAYRKPIERLSALVKTWESYAQGSSRSPKPNDVALSRSLPSKNEWNRLIRSLEVSNNEKNKMFIVLNSIYKGAGLSPMEFSALEHTVEETEPWTKAEVEKLWHTPMPLELKIAVGFLRTCFYTGLRPWCEAAVLEKHCVSNVIHVMGSKRREKGKVARVVPILPETEECLAFAAQIKPVPGCANLIFVNEKGRPLNHSTVADRLRVICSITGTEYHEMYDARRGLGTAMLRAGYSLDTVADLFGHKDIKTTRRYDQRSMEEKTSNFVGI